MREVVDEDLPVYYEHQRDPETAATPVFPPSERDVFMTHWAKALANASALTRTVVFDERGRRQHRLLEGDDAGSSGTGSGESSGAAGSQQGPRGTPHIVDARPLHAYVAKSNPASIRVLENCGFVEVGEHAGDDGIEELLLELSTR